MERCIICGEEAKRSLSDKPMRISKFLSDPIFRYAIRGIEMCQVYEKADNKDGIVCVKCGNGLMRLAESVGNGYVFDIEKIDNNDFGWYPAEKSKENVTYLINNYSKTKDKDLYLLVDKIITSMKKEYEDFGHRNQILKNFAEELGKAISEMKGEKIEVAVKDTNYTISRADDVIFIADFGKKTISDIRAQEHLSEKSMLKTWKKLKHSIDDSIEHKVFNVLKIPVERIVYYQLNGNIQYTTHISGGGSNNVANLAGAVIGDIFLGTAGALAGSKIGDQGLTSSTQEHDGRYVVLKFKDENNKITEKNYPFEIFEVFNKLIPDKEYSFVNINNNNVNESEQKISFADELRKYKALFDDGIITQEEFEAKKKQILGL